jgi:adenylate cyclase
VPGERLAAEESYRYGDELSPGCTDSPIRNLFEGAACFRRRLETVGAAPQLPLLARLAAGGATDYVAVPVLFSGGQTAYLSWASDRPGGFSNDDLALLHEILPLIALRLEIQALQNEERAVLRTYLGRTAAERVASGWIQRGQCSNIRAAIWYSDLEGFTAMSDRLPATEVMEILDSYFDCVAARVQAHGGEVLKFIGDGLLAAFNIDGASSELACCNAIDAAAEATEALKEVSAGSRENLRAGIALHVGDVLFGNIGTQDRLDFTVIGRAVNEATRIERLCRTLSRPVLISEAFRRGCQCRSFVSLGRHELRGVAEPQEIFAPGD